MILPRNQWSWSEHGERPTRADIVTGLLWLILLAVVCLLGMMV